MIASFFAAVLSGAVPADAPRCQIRQVHLPAGKIGPHRTIATCLKSELVRQNRREPARGTAAPPQRAK